MPFLRIFLCLWLAITPAFAGQSGLLLGVSSPSASVSKSYTFLNAYDWQSGGTPTSISFNVTMPGTSGRLIFTGASQNVAIVSAVYDPTGTNVTLTQDASLNGGLEGFFSANVTGSGTKVVTVTYAGNVGFNSQSVAFWLATGLTTGFDASAFNNGSTVNITVNSGDFLFAMNYPNASSGNQNWAANSTSSPTASRLSNTTTFGSAQLSGTADWSSPTVGTFTVSPGTISSDAVWAATYK